MRMNKERQSSVLSKLFWYSGSAADLSQYKMTPSRRLAGSGQLTALVQRSLLRPVGNPTPTLSPRALTGTTVLYGPEHVGSYVWS